jgi:hypothetical protein
MKTMILLIFLSVEKDFARRDSKLLSGPRKLTSFKYPSDPNFQSKIFELAPTMRSIFCTKLKQDIFDHDTSSPDLLTKF